MFVGLHAAIAMATHNPEIQIGEDQGAAFMGAAQNVMRHYGVTSTQKSIDWLVLWGAGLGMYVPMISAIRFRQAEEKRAAASAGIMHFPTVEARRRGPRPVETPPGQPGGPDFRGGAGDIIPDPLFTGEGPEAA